MTHQYESEILNKLMERDGFNIPSSVPPYEAEIKAYLINQVKQAYPKLTDYEAEWLLYNYTKHLPADFPISSVSNVTDASFENVVPFAYQSAILKGNTLVNMVTLDTTKEYVLEQDGSSIKSVKFDLIDGFENDIYTITLEMSNVNIVNPNGEWVVYINTPSEIDNAADNATIKSFIKNGKVSFTYKPSRGLKTKNWFNISLHKDSGVGSTITIKNVVVLKGDHTQEDIPYFEGMQSVKMPVLSTCGKNLFDFNDLELGGLELTTGVIRVQTGARRTKNFIDMSDVDTYTISLPGYVKAEGWKYVNVFHYDSNKKFLGYSVAGDNFDKYPGRKLLSNTRYIKITISQQAETPTDVFEMQIEKGSTATPYEPYKTNILTVNEDVELRGIGEVKDELNLLTGELTQRIGEVVLDGGNNYTWTINNNSANTIRFQSRDIPIPTQTNQNIPANILCDKLKVVGNVNWQRDEEQMDIGRKAGIYEVNVRIAKTKLSGETVEALKNYLQANPITVQYQLATESIKTVDLTTINEKGESVYFMPIEGTMHVTSSGETITPTFDMSVPVEATTQNLASFIDLEMEE